MSKTNIGLTGGLSIQNLTIKIHSFEGYEVEDLPSTEFNSFTDFEKAIAHIPLRDFGYDKIRITIAYGELSYGLRFDRAEDENNLFKRFWAGLIFAWSDRALRTFGNADALNKEKYNSVLWMNLFSPEFHCISCYEIIHCAGHDEYPKESHEDRFALNGRGSCAIDRCEDCGHPFHHLECMGNINKTAGRIICVHCEPKEGEQG